MHKALALAAVSALGLLSFAIHTQAHQPISNYGDGVVFEDGSIRVPENFRTDYVALGTWSVAGNVDTEGELGLHIVYADRRAVEAFRKDGKWPDGAVLVKELLATKTQTLTTGVASNATETEGYFVMVKDTVGRFDGNTLWGHGWGWAYFDADDRQNTTTRDYQGECMPCHTPARASDFIYDFAYPVLRD